MAAVVTALTLFVTAACGGDGATAPAAAGSGAAAKSAAASPSKPACTLVSPDVVGSTFDVSAYLQGAPSTAPFQDGKEYSCQFRAQGVWSLSVSVRVFTASQSIDDLVDIGVSQEPFATKVSGVGDAAAYVKRSDLIQFAAGEKSGAKVKLVVLLGSSGADDEAHFSTIAKEVLRNAPQ